MKLNLDTFENTILKQKIVPTPLYKSTKEFSYIVKPHGTIFFKIKRSKLPKF